MQEVKAFKCDYCGKLYRNKLVLRHEKFCKNNPNNNHRCLFPCKYLEVSREEGIKTFFCNKKEISMYTYKAESRKLECITRTYRMPLQCEDFDGDYVLDTNYDE